MKNSMRNRMKKCMAWILIFVMCVGMIQHTGQIVYASEQDSSEVIGEENPITYDEETDTYTMHGQNNDSEGTNSSYTLVNPFIGLDLNEELSFNENGYPVYTKGITIGYWVNVPEEAKDAILFKFELKDQQMMHTDDQYKLELCKAYSADDASYSMGTQEVYMAIADDGTETEYIVLSEYGSNVRYNPNYPTEGLYKIDSDNGTINVVKKGADSTVAENWTKIKNIGSGYYESYSVRYTEEGGEVSKIREGKVTSQLHLYASGSLEFWGDDLSGIQENPNGDNYGSQVQADTFNKLIMWANGAPANYGPFDSSNGTAINTMLTEYDKWHYVAITITNDYIQYYVDGVKLGVEYYNWWGSAITKLFNNFKAFNKGYGPKDYWISDSPAAYRAYSKSLMEILTDPNTTLEIGGQNLSTNYSGMGTVGTPDGVQIKEIKFYNTVVAEENITAEGIVNTEVFATPTSSIIPEATVEPTATPEPCDYTYVLLDDGTAEITGYTGSDTNLQIPSEIDGYKVTSIGNSAFENYDILTSINIPDGVTKIGRKTFYDCGSVKSITLPDSVTDIGMYAFGYCSALSSINIPNNLTRLLQGVFEGCSSLTNIDIPDSVNDIGWYVFAGCSSLTSIEIPEGVTDLGFQVFYGCANLENVVIPDSVTSIYWSAFEHCTSLASINIPNGVNSIGRNAFNGCISLENIALADSVTSIEDNAFRDCISLENVTLSNALTSIGEGAFSGSGLESITIPSSLKDISLDAFSWCNDLTSVTMQDGVTSIGNNAFSYCENLTYVLLPNSVSNIDSSAFYFCNNLNHVFYAGSEEQWNSLTIDSGNSNLQEATRHYNVSEDCVEICNHVDLSHTVSASYDLYCTLCEEVFATRITEYAEGHQKGELLGVVEPTCGEDGYSLYKCLVCGEAFKTDPVEPNGHSPYEVVEVVNPTCIKDGYYIYKCPDCGDEYEEGYASALGHEFMDGSCIRCGGLEFDQYWMCNKKSDGAYITGYYGELVGDIVIPSKTLSGTPIVGISDYAFRDCYDITSITLPDSVTSIGAYAFQDCVNLESINIPDGVTAIECETFSGCESLEKIQLPDSVTSIGYRAFEYCESLSNINIPDGVTVIESNTFEDCISLTNILIPDSIIEIEQSAFDYCTNMWHVLYSGSEEQWESITIGEKNVYLNSAIKHYNVSEDCIEVRNVVDATCVQNGSYDLYCDICKETFTFTTDTIEHTYDFIEEVSPKCNEKGYSRYQCTVCNDEHRTNYVDMIPHTKGTLKETIAATCIYEGYSQYQCLVCGEEYNDDYVEELGHVFSDGACSRCDIPEVDCIESLHSYESNCDETWTLYKPNAVSVSITFSKDTYVESNRDYIIIYDGNDNLIGQYTGNELAKQTITVEGDTIKIRLISDDSENYYGFSIVNVVENEIILYGDVNEDGYVDAADALSVLLYVTKLIDAFGGTYSNLAADMTRDGEINSLDALEIFKYAGKISDSNNTLDSTDYKNAKLSYVFNDDGTYSVYVHVDNAKLNRFEYGISIDGAELISYNYTLDFKNKYIWEGSGTCVDNYLNTEERVVISGVNITDQSFVDTNVYVMNIKLMEEQVSINLFDNTDSSDSLISKENLLDSLTLSLPEGFCHYSYVLLDDGTIEITDYVGFNKDEVVPSEIDGYIVSGINFSAFNDCNFIKTIKIPNTVMNISDDAFAACEDLVIYGYKDSYAEEYAKLNGITFSKWICEKHTEVVDEAVEATCTETGLTEGKHCSVCKEVLVKQEIVNALGHTEVIDKAVEATCTETGLTEGKHCSVCNEVLVKQEIIPAKQHTVVVDKAIEPTCTETGLTEGSHCSVCGEVFVAQEVVDALGHAKVIDKAVAPTCTTTGLTEGSHCSVCNEVFVVQEEVKALGHTEVVDKVIAPTCTETGFTEGKHCSVCNEVLVKQEIIPAKQHIVVVDKAIEPTCTETGLTEGSHCSVCGEVFVKQEIIEAFGHTEVIDKAVAPTCTETGFTEGKHCSVCNEVLVKQEVVDALSHTEVVDKAVAATCTETGLTEGKHCSVCNEVLVKQEVVEALGHTEVIDQAVAPTCTEVGLTEGKHCSVCNEILVAQEIIEALGHSYLNGVCENCDALAYQYEITSDGIMIVDCDESVTSLSIPSTIEGYIVVAIGESAFASCANLISLSLPNSVVTIGSDAFSGCENLVLSGYSGSYIEEYAAENGLMFEKTVCEVHTEVIDPAIEPTETETGLTEGKHCSVCGEVLVPQEVIPVKKVEVYYYGDISGDGTVNASDALAILKHAAKLETIEGELLTTLADINGDGNINASDALEALKVAAKLTDVKEYHHVPSEEGPEVALFNVDYLAEVIKNFDLFD